MCRDFASLDIVFRMLCSQVAYSCCVPTYVEATAGRLIVNGEAP